MMGLVPLLLPVKLVLLALLVLLVLVFYLKVVYKTLVLPWERCEVS